jgi:hypothetical protein
MQLILHMSAVKTGLGYLAIALPAVLASGAAQALVTRLHVKPIPRESAWVCSPADGLADPDLDERVVLERPLHPVLADRRRPRLPLRPDRDSRRSAASNKQEAGLASGLINTSQQIAARSAWRSSPLSRARARTT